MLGSEIIVKMLENYGVKHLFGLPGDTSLALYDALSKTDRLQHVLTRDERHLGYMADAYARVTSKPGVCEVPSGGGVTYLSPAIAEADGSSVPLISFASDVPLSSDEKSSLTALDQVSVLSSMTRFATRTTSPDFIPHMIRKAFRMANAGKTGPAHLTMPENVLSGSASSNITEKDLYAEEACMNYPAFRNRPDYQWVEKASELLANAERPIIIAGGGVMLSRAWEELKSLSEYLSIPVVTTINGKGSIAETSPLAMGVIGSNGGKPSSNQSVTEADVVLVLGTRMSSTIMMSPSLIQPEAKVIQVDSDHSQLGNNHKIDIALHGDVKLTLQDLLEAVKDRISKPVSASEWVLQLQKRLKQDFEQAEQSAGEHNKGNYIHPYLIIRSLEKMLPENNMLVLDAGYPTPYTSAYFRLKKAGRSFVDPRAQGSLGFSLPAAIGVKLAKPDSTVVGMFGDGSLAMCLGEMETVTRLNLPIIYLHFNNNSYGWIQNLQKIFCSQRYFSTSFDPSIDYAKVAQAHGFNAYKPENIEDLEKALGQAIRSDKATFIDIPTPTAAELTPVVAPWLAAECKPEEERSRKSY